MVPNLSRLRVKLIGCSFSLISIGYPVIFNVGQSSSVCDRIKESNVTTTLLNSTVRYPESNVTTTLLNSTVRYPESIIGTFSSK